MSQEEGKLRTDSRGPGPPIGVRDLPAPVRTSRARRASIPPGGVRRLRVSHRCGRGRGSSTGRLAHPPHSMREVEACSATTARGTTFVRPHCGRAELVCHINWIRRHGTFPSCRLRRKLHGPFSYVAGDAASYAWRRFDKTEHGYAGRRIPRSRARKSRNRISFACNAIMYEQYVILYYIDWAHLSGTQWPCTRLP